MQRRICSLFAILGICLAATALGRMGWAADLAVAPTEELLSVYTQLRQLRQGDQWAVTESVVWKRDAATFTFHEGRLNFAAPVEGRVLAAAFVGRGSFELDPPTPLDRQQIARFSKGPKLVDTFQEAVFFFTDESWAELQELMAIRAGGGIAAGSKTIASAQERYTKNFNGWIDNRRKHNFTIRNLAARMLADLTDPGSRGFFLADFKGKRHGDLLYHISGNRDLLLLPGFSNDEEVMLLHYNPGDYFEWWAGFHLKEEYANSPRPEHRTPLAHCRHARIDAEVGKNRRLSAAADLEIQVTGGPVRLLPFNLSGVLRISSIQDSEGNSLEFIQEDRKLDSDPWVILPEPAKANKIYKLHIAYEEDSTRDSHIIQKRGSGLYYVTSRTSWFPSFGAFDDRTRYFLRFRSPKKFKFIGTGRLVKSEKGKDFLETEWESEIPFGVVGFNYGDFVEKSQKDADLTVTAYTGKQIPDELNALRAGVDAAELASGPRGSRGGPLGVLTGGFNTRIMAGYTAGISYQALKLFEHYFGSLPFKTISVTQQPVRGYGQSWPTLIFLPYDSVLDSTTRQGLRLQESAEAREFYNIVAIHEMAHQWWGHMVGWKTYHDQWLSEGFAEFSAALYLKHFQPKKLNKFWSLRRKWLFSKNKRGHRPVEVGPLWLNYQLNAYLEERNSQHLIYKKGAYVLEMLRMMMEDSRSKNPDARFIAMMREFVSTYAGKNPGTGDFRRIVEKHMGEPMDWFFNQWVYGTEIPQYDLKYSLKDGGDGKTLAQVSLTQSEVSDSFRMRIPLYFHLNGRMGTLGLLQIQGSSTVAHEITLPFRPEKITLDEFHSVLGRFRQ